MALEEAAGLLAGWTAHQRDRPPQELRQHPVADGGVVEGQLQLGRTAGTKHHAVGVGDPDRRQIFIADEAAPRAVRLPRSLRQQSGVVEIRSCRRPRNEACRSRPSAVRVAIAHLRHQLRFGPRDALACRHRWARRATRSGGQRLRAGRGDRRPSSPKTRCRPCRRKCSVPFPRFRQQQRCQSAGRLRLAEADDDEIVGVDAFDLAPGARSAGLIGGIQPLADDALEPSADRPAQRTRGPPPMHVLAQLQRRGRIDMRRDQRGKRLLALDQRHRAKDRNRRGGARSKA